MKLTLNIYDDEMKDVIKTHEAEVTEISYGIIEDLLCAVELTKVDVKDPLQLGVSIAKALYAIKPIVKQIFKDLTDDELRNTKPNDLIEITVVVLTETLTQSFGSLGKLTRG